MIIGKVPLGIKDSNLKLWLKKSFGRKKYQDSQEFHKFRQLNPPPHPQSPGSLYSAGHSMERIPTDDAAHVVGQNQARTPGVGQKL